MSSKKFLKEIKDNDRDQFRFTIQYQLELLKYLVQITDAVTYMDKMKSSYFTLLEHGIICETLIKAYKKHKKIPGEVVILETVKDLLNTKEYASLVLKDDLKNIESLIHEIYNKTIKDPEIIKKSLAEFIAFIELKDLNETTDFSDYQQYQKYYQKLGQIISNAEDDGRNQDQALYMVDNVIERQLQRRINPDVIPTPFKQVNALTNAGGYEAGSIAVLLDKAKAKKTFSLINVARGYLSKKKNVLYIDTENGAKSIMNRMVQSTLNKTKKDMLTGDYDEMEKRHMRKYRRLKVEFIVKRVSALNDDANTIANIIEENEARLGIKIHVVIIDYAGKLASIRRDRDDFDRINNVYIELQNMAFDLGIEHIWTAHHITREGSKHQQTRYEENDIAGSIAIVRNAVAIWGLNSTEEEAENNIQRWEVVVQRDGLPNGRALFNIDVERQRMKEFSMEARKVYDEQVGKKLDESFNKKGKKVGKNHDPVKKNNVTGDI